MKQVLWNASPSGYIVVVMRDQQEIDRYTGPHFERRNDETICIVHWK